MRIVTVIVVMLLVVSSVTPLAVASAPAQDPVEVIVVFEDRAAIDESVITSAGGSVTGGESIDLVPVRFATVPPSAIPAIEAHGKIVAVDRNAALASTNQKLPWGIDRIGAANGTATVMAAQQANVTVAVLDTGVAADHEDLNGSVVWGADTVGRDPIRYGVAAADDPNGHGTHIAGTIAANDNTIGVVGVVPHAELYAMRVLNVNGTGTVRDLIEGIDAAVAGQDNETGTADDADILTMSLGTTEKSDALRTTVRAAADHAILVAAAGNAGDGNASTDDVLYPAKFDAVIAVGATNVTNGTPDWSSDGPAIELAAPGVDIRSTESAPDDYAGMDGTSVAAPHVAGTAALAIAKDLADDERRLNDSEVRWLLQDTALDIGETGLDNRSGHGLVSADAALRTGRFVPALADNLAPPTNLDNDMLLEDVNGNGRLDIADVQAFYVNSDGTVVQNHVDVFDFNDNGQIEIGDIQALFVEYQRS